jgi:cardiolipin synthase
MRGSWIPNAITLARMAMAAPLAWLILAEAHVAALTLALVAGFSDALDGLLAKRFGWQSRLGGLLDPLADKLMLLACFVALALTEALPAWVTLLVIGRDLVIVAGAVAYHNLVGPLNAAPSAISKLTTVLQIVLVLVVLVDGLAAVALPGWSLAGLIVATAAATVASGVHYVISWTLKARRAWREQARSP